MFTPTLAPETTPMQEVRQTARRILVVEDEAVIAVLIERCLQDLGYSVVGPVSKLTDAMKLAEAAQFDAAILDVTIRGGKVYPVAEALLARAIPFVLASGYSRWSLPETLRNQPHLVKPFRMDELEDQLNRMFPAKA